LAEVMGVRCLPFKPAESFSPGDEPDSAIIVRHCGLEDLRVQDVAPLSYPIPKAPGLAADAAAFTQLPAPPVDLRPLALVRRHLGALERRYAPDITLIEGAGGLWVPMPGGTWQPTWIRALGGSVIIVASAGLGTINHTLLTHRALTSLDLPIAGFVLNLHAAFGDAAENRCVIETATSLTFLGYLPDVAPDRFAQLTPTAALARAPSPSRSDRTLRDLLVRDAEALEALLRGSGGRGGSGGEA
jgi:dethiobiotin synthetase